MVTDCAAEAGLGQVFCVSDTVYVPPALTVIDCVVSPSLHRLPDAADDVRITLSPGQNARGPDAVMVGAAGVGLTVTTTDADGGLVQLPTVWVTVYVPDAETVILCVVAALLQVLPVGTLDVRTTLPPWQNVSGPLAEIVGAVGPLFVPTMTLSAKVHPRLSVTVT